MNTIQNILFSNWHLMRIIRLGAGVFIAFNAWQEGSGLIGLLGGLFILQALTNSGCCGPAGCEVPKRKVNSGTENEILFSEIQTEKGNENKF